jgi:hypothetical protein
MMPTSNNMVNMFLPSGTIKLYARVMDSFGATSQEYTDTVTVRAPFGRRLLGEFSWDLALTKVADAVKADNSADTNMLCSCVATEANKAAVGGSLPVENVTGILDSLVTSMTQSVSKAVISSDYVCEVAGIISSLMSKPAHVGNNTLMLVVDLLKQIITSDKTVKASTDCATQFYTSFNNAVAASTLLSQKDALSYTSSAQVFNTVEGSGFRVMTLVAKALIEGMSTTVSSDAATSVVSRQLASSASEAKTYTSQTMARGQQKYSVTMPNMVQMLGLAPADLVDTVLEFTDKTPVVAGSEILSMGVGISLAKAGSKLAVSNTSTPIVFTIPLVQAAKPAPLGLIVDCKCCVYLLVHTCVFGSVCVSACMVVCICGFVCVCVFMYAYENMRDVSHMHYCCLHAHIPRTPNLFHLF